MVGAEEDRYDNILLCLELLSHLCSRDFFSFDEPDSFEDSSSKLVLIGLDIIVPHIDVGIPGEGNKPARECRGPNHTDAESGPQQDDPSDDPNILKPSAVIHDS
eukprot:sb/3478138/